MIVTAATKEEAKDPRTRPYGAVGACLDLLRSKAPEVLLSGPAGTGKSRACLEKIHGLAVKYPDSRHLIVRKTRASLTESALVTFEQHVVPRGYDCLRGSARSHRQAYHYPNGSQIVVGGMDNASRIMSTEFDTVYVQEAIELAENDWESLTTRLRNGKMPYQQIIADTNPDKPTHWIKKRCDKGATRLIESRHTDNPVYWNGRDWTPAGVNYLAKLDALTGPRKQRLRFGRWVQAEGVVYEGWDAAVHVVDRFPIPERWKRIIAIDFGWNDPFVALWFAIDEDGRMYLYREYVRTHRLVEDHARVIRDIIAAEGREINGIVCDHDREDRETLARHLGRSNFPAKKEIEMGIQAVASRLVVQGDGKPRLFVLRDCLDERDPLMVEALKPIGLVEEIDGYVWSQTGGKKKGEEPVDKDNHSLDALRYAVRFADDGAGAWEVHGSSPKENPLNALPSGVFGRGDAGGVDIDAIMGMRM